MMNGHTMDANMTSTALQNVAIAISSLDSVSVYRIIFQSVDDEV